MRWEKIDATTNTVLQAGTIGSSSADYYYPAINANSRGDVVIGFTRSSSAAGNFPSSYVVVGSSAGGVGLTVGDGLGETLALGLGLGDGLGDGEGLPGGFKTLRVLVI